MSFSKADEAVRPKNGHWVGDGVVEEDDGFGVESGGVAQVIGVPIRAEAVEDGGSEAVSTASCGLPTNCRDAMVARP